jgi:hypothetical protein
MVRHDGIVGLVLQRRFLPWANTGYGPALPLPDLALHPSAEYRAAAAGRGVSCKVAAR